MTKEYASTASEAMSWTTSCRASPPVNRPVSNAKNPGKIDPRNPPTRCTPTTSSESSNPSRYLRSTATAQRSPERKPSGSDQPGASEAQAGVIATSPAMAPEAAPIEVGLPLRSVAKMPAKIIHEPNLARSAIAPEMRAVVMIANVAPEAAPASPWLSCTRLTSAKSPNGLPANSKNAAPGTVHLLEPYRIHSTATSPSEPKLSIIIEMTLFSLDHAAGEEREAWRHQQHERRADEEPGETAVVHRASSRAPRRRGLRRRRARNR